MHLKIILQEPSSDVNKRVSIRTLKKNQRGGESLALVDASLNIFCQPRASMIISVDQLSVRVDWNIQL
jgi:hypothetical protein